MLLYQVWKKQNLTFFPITWREDDQLSNAKMWRQGTEILKLLAIYLISPKRIFRKSYAPSHITYQFDRVTI